jgi:dihydroorotase
MIPSPKTCFINARLLDPASKTDTKGSLLSENGKIVDFGADVKAPPDALVIDLKGTCLAPGLIDIRVHTGEPGHEHKENFLTLSDAAAAGGVTAIAAMPNTDPIIDNVAGVAYIDRRAHKAKGVKTFPYAAMTVQCKGEEMTEMGLLAEAGVIGFTDGMRAVDNVRLLRRIMMYARSFDLLLLQPAVHPALSEGALMNGGETATRLGLSGLCSEAEALQVMVDLRLAEATGARLHIGPVSMKESVDLIRAAKAKGIKVTCSTSPHYFTLTEQDVGDYRTFTKTMPPLRDETNRRAMVEGLADGTIDIICSNHCPQDVDQKRLPYAQAAYGAIGIETLLAISLRLVHEKKMTMLDLLASLTSKPAELLRLPLGRLAKGGAADLVIFDPEKPWRIVNENLHSKSKNSPYDGMPVMGGAMMTILDGRVVFDELTKSKAA